MTVTATEVDPTTGVVVAQSTTTVQATEVLPASPGGQPTWTASGSGGPPASLLSPIPATEVGMASATSASGNLDLTVHWTNPSNYTYNSEIEYCWADGKVYNCSSSPGSSTWPYMSTYFTGLPDLGEKVVSNLEAESRHYFDWTSVANSGFKDFSEGHACATIPTTGVCVLNQYPTITINVHSNGSYNYSGTAPN
jgi:hypothetical protein